MRKGLNALKVCGDVAHLDLCNRKGDVVAQTLVSASDLPRLEAFGIRWFANWSKLQGQFRAMATVCGTKRTSLLLHRFLMDAPEGLEVDHINGNTLDNRRENLQLVTRNVNKQNCHGARSDSKTGVRGVFWDSRSNRYRARIWANGRSISLGQFETLDEAKQAAEEGRRKHFVNSQENRRKQA